MEIGKDENKSQHRSYPVVLRFSTISKAYSFQMPGGWTIKKLKSFISYSFKEDIGSNLITLYYGAKALQDDNLVMDSLFKDSNEVLFQIVITLKQRESKFSNILTKMEIMGSPEFDEVEKIAFGKYYHSLASLMAGVMNNTIVPPVPLMHYYVRQRVSMVNMKNTLKNLSAYEIGKIDHMPIRDYFKIELFFKLFLFFILFGVHMKGYNLPFFLSLLVIYYWYSIYTEVNAFYEKKIAEIKINQNELKELKILDDEFSEIDEYEEDAQEKEKENENENLQKEELNAEKEKEKENLINTNINDTDDIKIENLKENDPQAQAQAQGKDEPKKHLQPNKTNQSAAILNEFPPEENITRDKEDHPSMEKEMKGIDDLIDKLEKGKKKKGKSKLEENEETHFK